MYQLIRLGDTSSHGGSMVTAGGKATINGIIGCVDGDLHSCPIKDHGVTPVVGTAKLTSNGKRHVRVGDVAGCGAVLTSGSGNTTSA